MKMNAAMRMHRTDYGQGGLRRRLLPVLLAGCFGTALANPLGPQVVSGQASFLNQGNVLSVTNTPGAIINWQSFSINPGELTRFIQQNANSAVLNRITGQDPSQILGALQSNGRVFLVNPNGILFGQGAQVDVNGLVASTLNISNEDFLNGKMLFKAGDKAGKLKNEGAISTPAGGQVFLIAPNVENSGIITSPKGDVMLAAGHTVQLVDTLNPDLRVVLSAPEHEALNLGQVIAQGGRMGIYGALVKQRGVINADSAVVGENGKVVLKASRDTLLEAGSRTSARGAGKGGEIQVLGERVGLFGDASVDASGALGGGTVLLGGDYQGKNTAVMNAKQTLLAKDARVSADALTDGDGGKIILWGDESTQAYGTISSRGGTLSGNGGFVEVSGHFLDMQANVDTTAAHGATGTLLLDPADLYISTDSTTAGAAGMSGSTATGGGGGSFTGSTSADSLLTLSTLTGSLGTSNVNVTSSSGSIKLVDALSWGSANSLTLIAGNDINFSAPISAGAGSIDTQAGGNIYVNANIVSSTGTVDLYGGASTTGNITLAADITAATIGLRSDAGNIVQSSGKITANNLVAYAQAGSVSLASSTNAVGKIAGYAITGTGFTFVNNGSFSVDTVSTTRAGMSKGIRTAGAANVSLTSATGNITVADSDPTGYGVTTSGTGNISLTATAGSITQTTGTLTTSGTLSASAGAGISLGHSVSGANIELAADSIDIQAGSTVTGSTSVTLKPKTPHDIKIGVPSGDDAAGALRLSQDEINRITSTGILRIGDTATTGNLDVVSALALGTGTNTLVLQAGGEIRQDAGAKIIVDKLGLRSLGKVHLTDENMVNYIAGVTGDMGTNVNRNFSFNNVTSGLTVGSGIDGMSGIMANISGTYSTGATGVITLKSAGALLQEPGALLGGKAVFAEGSKVILEQVNPTGIIAGKSTGNTSADKFSYKSSNGIVTVTDGGYTGIQSSTPAGFSGVKLQSTTNNITVSSPIDAGDGQVILNASGAINGSGLLTAHDLSATASGGIGLSNTKVKTLAAVNSGANSDISIANVSSPDPLYLYDVSQSVGTGNITISNTGPVIVHSGYTVSTGAGNITLKSNATGSSSDTLTVSGNVTSATGNIILEAGSTISGNAATTGAPGTVSVLDNRNSTSSGSDGTSVPPPPSPPPPTLADCTSNPALSGCSAVLPPLSTCTATPSTAGCSAVLPSLGTCMTVPTTAGCNVVLPPISVCTTAPATEGCTAVLPTVSSCTANPAQTGCSVVLPSLITCSAAPATAGCSVVLPSLGLCEKSPATPGCAAVLPPVSVCTAAPSTAGCSVVLPTLDICTSAPATAGCSAVLPSMSVCTAAPATAGCTAVLPTLAQCSANPRQEGCSAVVPTASNCVTNPSAPECQAVLPNTGTNQTPANTFTKMIAETSNTVVKTTAQASLSKVQPGSGSSSGGSSKPSGSSEEKKDDRKTTSTVDDSGAKKNEPAKKMYCN